LEWLAGSRSAFHEFFLRGERLWNFFASERFYRCAMGSHTERPAFTGGVSLFLSSIGVVSAAIIIILGIASVSSLDLGKGMEPFSGGGDQVEAKPILSEALPINGSAAPVPADATPPNTDSHLSEPPSLPPRPAPAALSAQEVGWAPPQPVEHPPSGDEELQPESAAPPMRASTTPLLSDEDQVTSGFPVPPEKTANPSAQNANPYVRSPTTNIGVRELRLRRECGPIKDRALRRSCIASFNIDYPAR
jgi:hypothetical protein